MEGGKRYKRLNYNVEDIDFFYGGLKIETNNNNGAVGTELINRGTNPLGTRGGNVLKSISKTFKPVGKSFEKVGKTFDKATTAINPISYALADKKTSKLMSASGDTTRDYILPAVVSVGKPIYDTTFAVGSTLATGNPLLGKIAGDALFNEMVKKKGFDPRKNQKSKTLGTASSAFGNLISKPYSAGLG
jgi:hypothetical protein